MMSLRVPASGEGVGAGPAEPSGGSGGSIDVIFRA